MRVLAMPLISVKLHFIPCIKQCRTYHIVGNLMLRLKYFRRDRSMQFAILSNRKLTSMVSTGVLAVCYLLGCALVTKVFVF